MSNRGRDLNKRTQLTTSRHERNQVKRFWIYSWNVFSHMETSISEINYSYYRNLALKDR